MPNAMGIVKTKELKLQGSSNAPDFSLKVQYDELHIKRGDMSLMTIAQDDESVLSGQVGTGTEKITIQASVDFVQEVKFEQKVSIKDDLDISRLAMEKFIWFFQGANIREYLTENCTLALALADNFFKGGLQQQLAASNDPAQISYLTGLLDAPLYSGKYTPENSDQDRAEMLFMPTNNALIIAIGESGFDITGLDENTPAINVIGSMAAQMSATPSLGLSLQMLLGRASLHSTWAYGNFVPTYDELLEMDGVKMPLVLLARSNFPGVELTVKVVDNEVYMVGPVDETKLIRASGLKGRRGCFHILCEKLLNIPMPS